MNARRAVLLAGGLVAFVALVVGGFWLSAREVGTQLDLAREYLTEAQDAVAVGDPERAAEAIESGADRAADAVAASSGPMWAVSAALPVIGATPQAVRVTARSLDRAVSALEPAVRLLLAVRAAEVVGARGAVAMEPYRGALPSLEAAHAEVRAAFEALAVAPSPASGDLVTEGIERNRVLVATQLRAIDEELEARLVNIRIVPALLGANEPTGILLAVLDPTVARGSGGSLTAWALLRADDGRLTLAESGMADELPALDSWPAAVDPGVRAHYGGAALTPTGMNLTPDNPTAAQLWAQSWRERTGDPVDAVLSIDIPALAELLAAAERRVTLPEGALVTQPDAEADVEGAAPGAAETVTGGGAAAAETVAPAARAKLSGPELVDYLLDGIHRSYPSPEQAGDRLAVTESVIRRAIRRVIRANDGEGMAAALATQIGDGRVRAWARDADLQAVIAQTELSGGLGGAKGPQVAVATIADDGLALDGYVDRSVEYRVGRCPDLSGQVTSQVEVTLRGALPKDLGEVPAGLLGGTDPGTKGPRREVVVQVHLPRNATLTDVRIQGKTVDPDLWQEQGRPALAVPVALRPRSSRTVLVTFDEAFSRAPGSLQLPPLVGGWEATVFDRPCAPEVSASAAS